MKFIKDAKSNRNKVNNISDDNYTYKVFIDCEDFQSKVLENIGSDEFNAYFSNTIFSELEDSTMCKSAFISGMVYASMLTLRCEPFCVKAALKKGNGS